MAVRKDELTETQIDVYMYWVRSVMERGFQPTFKEAAEHFGVYPKAIQDTLAQLARKGLVRLPPHHMDRCVVLSGVRFVPQIDPDKFIDTGLA